VPCNSYDPKSTKRSPERHAYCTRYDPRKAKEETEIALTNPHVLLYLGLKSACPPLGDSPIDVPVPPAMAAVLNRTANDNQANFPFHHFFVDTSNYTGLGEATPALVWHGCYRRPVEAHTLQAQDF
jgi:hypothetical protein